MKNAPYQMRTAGVCQGSSEGQMDCGSLLVGSMMCPTNYVGQSDPGPIVAMIGS
ncbi:hypothetical protein QJS10_CPB17g00404 [Acorus calamus]|uniref:Uncharacterized protein n=1 Tax=Acorus calamus TaxID=4465 RepID=A0AAV9CW82_ACOCL|nr:hypothetical protein QJS10_CPB17g00404 [Acorus calamus]